MNKFLKRIEKDIEDLKVLNFKEQEIISDCQFLSLKEGFYQLNNGQTIRREIVSPNHSLQGSAVCIFAVTTDQKILLVIQPRVTLPTKEKVNIELPAGYTETGETAIQAGIRELKEETGYITSDMRVIDSYYPSLGASSERIDLLLALNCKKVGEQQLDKDEFIHYEEVTQKEFEELLKLNKIMDANARIGYYHYLEYLKKEGCE